jgi:BirA family biotin operon repressor/biotin-[acetyl-CoA-carboxylase] ligase
LILWPQGYRKTAHCELDSTNEEARRLAEAGEEGPLWVTAQRQTKGRGRRGRAWETGEGNLAATLLLRPRTSAVVGSQISFVAALAVADLVAHFAPDAAVAVKWPNDVLACGSKLAGILLEAGSDWKGAWLAIGIGINLASFPPNTEFPATSLAHLGLVPPPPDLALGVLAARFAHWYDVWMNEGFELLRAAWLAKAVQLGAPIRARMPHETQEGIFEGIDATGSLLLNQEGRVLVIAAGEVFF